MRYLKAEKRVSRRSYLSCDECGATEVSFVIVSQTTTDYNTAETVALCRCCAVKVVDMFRLFDPEKEDR